MHLSATRESASRNSANTITFSSQETGGSSCAARKLPTTALSCSGVLGVCDACVGQQVQEPRYRKPRAELRSTPPGWDGMAWDGIGWHGMA